MKYSAHDLSLAGLFGALGVVIPILFHAVGMGAVFLPMHLPVVLCGFLVSPRVAVAVGIVTPLASSALTGMPPFVPTAMLMTLELGALAGAASVFYRKLGIRLPASLVLAMIFARVIGGLERLMLAPLLGFEQGVMTYLTASIILSWPGILIQLIAVPAAMVAILKTSRNVYKGERS